MLHEFSTKVKSNGAALNLSIKIIFHLSCNVSSQIANHIPNTPAITTFGRTIMIFNSLEFIVFALLFFLLWPLAKKENNGKWAFITAMSFVFYGWWDWRFLFLIIGSGLIDYLAGLWLVKRPAHRKLFLVLSLAGNLGSLSVFKYSLFFAKAVDDLAAFLGAKTAFVEHIPEFALILPVGISFYTFQSMSYTIDVYRGRLKPTQNILHFFSYLSMFPQLVAGPIVRAKDLLVQLAQDRKVEAIQRWHAIKMMVFGMFQKVVIADNLSFFVDSAFEGKTAYDGSAYWWAIMIAFSFQIYCDFSGYSLMARGLAKYMGYHFKMNFNHPYLSLSLREFWTRWHISLSTWFRDYVYIPIGGSRRGLTMGLFALWATMLLSGLWHGANYTFVIWAAIHALFSSIERITKWNKTWSKSRWRFTLIPIIFVQALVAWVYFRAADLTQANMIVAKLFSFTPSDFGFISNYLNASFMLLLAISVELTILLRKTNQGFSVWYKQSHLDIALVGICIMACILFRGEGAQFIYFQF